MTQVICIELHLGSVWFEGSKQMITRRMLRYELKWALENSEEEEIFWSLRHSIICIWLRRFSGQWLLLAQEQVYECVYIYIYIYIYQFVSVMAQGLYWVTACFIFVCQLDASWDHWAAKCCYYCLFCTLKQSLLQKRIVKTI